MTARTDPGLPGRSRPAWQNPAMRIPRVVGRVPARPGDTVLLEGDEATHVGRVLRGKPGMRVELFDGDGAAGQCEVVRVGRDEVELRLVERLDTTAGPSLEVVVAVAVPKGKRVQRLAEALTEVGVAAWIPFDAARSEERPPRADEVRRWTLEACKQCRRNRGLTLEAPLDAAALARLAGDFGLAIVCDTQGARPLRELLAAAPPARALVVVGPEGGLSPEERTTLAAGGLQPVSLGPTVLRVETAATVAVGALAVAWL
jgi:16S rRNA (uracil1498-N3)-methyltransferase